MDKKVLLESLKGTGYQKLVESYLGEQSLDINQEFNELCDKIAPGYGTCFCYCPANRLEFVKKNSQGTAVLTFEEFKKMVSLGREAFRQKGLIDDEGSWCFVVVTTDPAYKDELDPVSSYI